MDKRCGIIIGNWKMNGLRTALATFDAIAIHAEGIVREKPWCEIGLSVPATLLRECAERNSGALLVGGQDCHEASSGAHTGEISAAMLRDCGAEFVLLGHSERRAGGESSSRIAGKLLRAQRDNLRVVLCVGETATDRDAGEMERVIEGQLSESLAGEVDPARLLIAYEPVWAIGTGRVATMTELAAIFPFIRSLLRGRFDARGDVIPLLYGGSVSADNAAQLLAIEGVSGLLVGGASLQAESFGGVLDALLGLADR